MFRLYFPFGISLSWFIKERHYALLVLVNIYKHVDHLWQMNLQQVCYLHNDIRRVTLFGASYYTNCQQFSSCWFSSLMLLSIYHAFTHAYIDVTTLPPFIPSIHPSFLLSILPSFHLYIHPSFLSPIPFLATLCYAGEPISVFSCTSNNRYLKPS